MLNTVYLILVPQGTFTYTPNADYQGVDQFTYQASDGENLSNETTVNLNIHPVNDVPTFVNAPASLTVNQNEGLFSFDFLVSPGPSDESTQDISIQVQSTQTELAEVVAFTNTTNDTVAVQLRIMGQPGDGQLFVSLRDSGGVEFGGVDSNAVNYPY